MTDLGTFGGKYSEATSVNDNQDVVGYADTYDSLTHAFYYHHSTNSDILDIGTLGGSYSTATAINNQGQIVGYSTYDLYNSEDHAFLYSNGVMTDLNQLITGSNWVLYRAMDINDSGQIVGVGRIVGDYSTYRAFLLTPVTVPLPASGWLFISSLSCLGLIRVRRFNS